MALVITSGTPAARADGAFPEAQSIMLPRARQDVIILATTFGLVSTEDRGKTWLWSCEAANTPMSQGGQYVMGPPPAHRIYAKTDIGIASSATAACSWVLGGGALVPADPSASAPVPFDVFPDPTDPTRVFVLANDGITDLSSAYRSSDGGATYAGPIFTAPAGDTLTGIESSAANPRTVYLTMTGASPRLATSKDGGDTWIISDLGPTLGAVAPALAAVDPVDDRILYLRVVSVPGTPPAQGIAISRDAGMTWTVPLQLMNGSLAGFARVSDQIILAVGEAALPNSLDLGPALFRSDDGGRTFVTEIVPFHPRGLAQRDGIVFVATKDVIDGFALASSSDGGRTWQPRLRFREIAGTKGCVRAACADSCLKLAELVFSGKVCSAPGGGCGCGLDGSGGSRWSVLAGVALLVIGVWRPWGRRRVYRARR